MLGRDDIRAKAVSALTDFRLREGDEIPTDIFDQLIPRFPETELVAEIVGIIDELASRTGILLLEDGHGTFVATNAASDNAQIVVNYLKKLHLKRRPTAN